MASGRRALSIRDSRIDIFNFSGVPQLAAIPGRHIDGSTRIIAHAHTMRCMHRAKLILPSFIDSSMEEESSAESFAIVTHRCVRNRIARETGNNEANKTQIDDSTLRSFLKRANYRKHFGVQ